MSNSNLFFRSNLISLIILLFYGCASSPVVQPQINSLAVGGQYKYALKLLDEYKVPGYGYNNRLLYYLDSGLVKHFAGHYKESIADFEKAKDIYEELYTISVSKGVETWLVNDNLSPYRAEDHERVLINIFQAINYMMLGNEEEAAVEAREVNDALKLINKQYGPDEKNKYNDDAFARFLMGVLFQSEKTASGYNNAFIAYRKAFELYNQNFSRNYETPASSILKENLMAVAEFMGAQQSSQARGIAGNIQFSKINELKNKAEVYLIIYYGLSPIKHGSFIPIPLPDGYILKFAFPQLDTRTERGTSTEFKAKAGGTVIAGKTEIMTDIGKIAIQTFKDRKARVITKSTGRVAAKYIAEKSMEAQLEKEHGESAARWFRYLSSLYNISSEQPDLRSWQTLPSEIWMSRLILSPGEYEFYLNDQKIQIGKVEAGETKFITVRKQF